jgi:hypothetical protein
MNTQRLQSSLRIFLTALIMTLALTGCPSDSYDDSGSGNSSGGSASNGCNNSNYPCNSGGYCCPRGQVGCEGYCYSSPSAAYSDTGNNACLSVTTVCP